MQQPNHPIFNFKQSADQLSIGLIKTVTLVAVIGFIFLIPFGNYYYDGLIALFGAASLGLSVVVLFIYGTHKNYNLYHLLFAILSSWVLITTFWSVDAVYSVQSGINIANQFLISMVISLVITSTNKLRAAYQAYVFGTAVGSAIIFYNYVNGIESIYWARYSIKNYEPDGVGIILAFGIPMAAFLTTQYKSKLFILFNMSMLAVLMFAIFLNGTRTASIIAIFGLAYWLFTHRKASLHMKVLLAGILAIALITVVVYAPKNSVDRILSSKKSATSGTFNGRTVIWAAAIKKWKLKPIIGSGIGSFEYIISTEHVEISNAHNTYIHILFELGIIGLSLYLLMLMLIASSILVVRQVNDKVFLLTLLMTIMVGQLTMNLIYDKEMWFVLTLLAIHSHYLKGYDIK